MRGLVLKNIKLNQNSLSRWYATNNSFSVTLFEISSCCSYFSPSFSFLSSSHSTAWILRTSLWISLIQGKVKVTVTQLCPILCNPMDYTVHGILQARILEWVAFPISRGSSQPRNQTQVSHIAGGFFTSWATREPQEYWSGQPIPSPADLPDPGIELGSPALLENWGSSVVSESGVTSSH